MHSKSLFRSQNNIYNPKPHVIYFGVKYSISSAKKAKFRGFGEFEC